MHTPTPWRRAGRAFKIAVRLVVWLTAAVASCVLWLEWAGVPAWLRDRILAEFASRGVILRIESVRFSLWQGIVADGASWYAHAGDARPALHADHVDLDCDWIDALLGRPFLRHVAVAGGSVDPLPSVAGGLPVVTNIHLEAGFEPGGLRLDRLNAPLPGLDLTVRGYVVGFGGASKDGGPRKLPDWPSEAVVRDWQHRVAAWGLPVFEPGSRADIDFLACPEDPARIEATFHGAGNGVCLRGLRIDRWAATGAWKTGLVTVASVLLRQGTNDVRASAAWSPAAGTAELQAAGTVPATFLRAAPLPAEPAARLDRIGLRLAEPVSFELRVPRGPWTNAAERAVGRVRLPPTEVMGVEIGQADVRFHREGSRLRFDAIEVILGHDRLRGPLRGEGSFDLATGVYEGRGTTAFDPSALLPLMHPIQAQIVGAAVFRSAPPEVAFVVSGQLSDLRRLVLAADVRARDFLYQGCLVREASARVSASNEVMRLDALNLVRAEGRASGWVEQNFRTRQVRMDVRGDADPCAVAQMIAPAVHRFVRKFRVEGPARWQAAGTIDYGALRDNDLRMTVDAERLGLKWFVAERAQFEGTVRGRHVELRNLKGRLCGGAFDGSATFDLPEAGRLQTRYAIAGKIAGADFQRLMQQLTDGAQASYEGRMDAVLRLSGLMGPGQGATAVGDGTLAIREGRLFQIPLFGEFSRFLNSLYPGLGFAQQSGFTSTFKIANGRVTTDEAELQGELVTMRGRGSYHFDERLDFAIEAKLLRGGAVAEVFRLLTLPLTKLFEFDLVGTLRRPEWRPHNLPEGLWRML